MNEVLQQADKLEEEGHPLWQLLRWRRQTLPEDDGDMDPNATADTGDGFGNGFWNGNDSNSGIGDGAGDGWAYRCRQQYRMYQLSLEYEDWHDRRIV